MTLENNSYLISLEDINISFREGDSCHNVLHDCQLSVMPKECISVLGRSGSGKTTLLNLIAGLLKADSGRYQACGQDVSNMNEKQRLEFRRLHIGYIFQYYNLIPTLSAKENIEFALNLINRSDRLAWALNQCKTLGLESCLDKLPRKLSGGQQQRLAIVRALALEPKILLADEPTGNLDQETGDQVAKMLFDSVKESGTTMILVTHAKDLALLSDKQYKLNKGQLVLES